MVQLRMKEASTAERVAVATEVLPAVEAAGAVLIIDDDAEAVRQSGAHGLHVGRNDMPVAEARRLLPGKIVGATANSAADIIAAARNGADYAGLGPYRFTTTKKNLSPLRVSATQSPERELPEWISRCMPSAEYCRTTFRRLSLPEPPTWLSAERS